MKIKILIALTITLALSAVATVNPQTAANKFTEREVTFAGAGGLQLRGTLVLPSGIKGKAPGVLLLSGSGPTDRNGNAPPSIVTDLLKQIAERLAAEGYASLRFDKRAAHGYLTLWPKEVAALNDFFSWDNFVGDARAGLAFLQTQPEVNSKQTVIAGHSEGAIIAMQLAHDLEGKSGSPAGLVLLSSPGRTLGVVLTEQINASLRRGNITGDAAKPYQDNLQLAINQVIKDGTTPANLLPALAPLFPPSALKLLQVELALDPTKALSGYSGPILVIQGEKDIQVSPVNDFPLLQTALKQRKHGTYKAVVVLSASHNLKRVDNENAEPGFTGPVLPPVLDNISDWLRQTIKR
jgi:pimeloyl-ACP methyl ester carboxylesterase